MGDPTDPTSAVLAAALEVLEANGNAEAAAIVDDAELVPAGRSEHWEVGSREVDARPFALVVSPRAFVALREPAKLEALRDALAAVLRSESTELSTLHLLVRLPGVGRPWGHVYRTASSSVPVERPTDEAVLAGATALASALDDEAAERALAQATLESVEVPSSSERALRRYVLHLGADALARADKNRPFSDRLRWLVEQAATRASEAVADVELRLRLP